jgi:hypothetical protein
VGEGAVGEGVVMGGGANPGQKDKERPSKNKRSTYRNTTREKGFLF